MRQVLAILSLLTVAACDSTPDVQREDFGRVLSVGPGKTFAMPSDAAAVALPGDRIEIAPGDYTDCAVWTSSSLAIVAMGDVTIRDKTCENKAIFVIKGHDITVRGIVFTGAKARAHNGAGIRAEGANLTVENSKFIDNEEGILASPVKDSTILIRGSYFKGNGNCIQQCAHGVYAGRIARLVIEDSEFVGQHIGHHVKSRALDTELTDNVIHDGPDGNSSYLVDIPNGGILTMRGNRLEKGPQTDNPSAAIAIGAEGVTNPTPQIVIEDNSFANLMDRDTFFVRNFSTTPVMLSGNRFTGQVTPVMQEGAADTARDAP
jgi:hypothetical protein